jgi:hypothetical protein
MATIPDSEWAMPIGFSPNGDLVTLREVQTRHEEILDFSQLTAEQQVALVTRRIELREEIKLFVIADGPIDKARALAEVRAQSGIGKVLVEIEGIEISELLRQARAAGTRA